MFDTVTGLPVHVLVVHAVLVMVPLAAFGVVVIAAVPRWRERYGPLVLAAVTAGLVLVPVATQSGVKLKDRIDASGVVARQIDRHSDLGALVIWPTLVLWVLTVALVLMSRSASRAVHGGHSVRSARSGRGLTMVAVLAVLAAITAGGIVARVGHLGSTAVWSCTIGSDACR